MTSSPWKVMSLYHSLVTGCASWVEMSFLVVTWLELLKQNGACQPQRCSQEKVGVCSSPGV